MIRKFGKQTQACIACALAQEKGAKGTKSAKANRLVFLTANYPLADVKKKKKITSSPNSAKPSGAPYAEKIVAADSVNLSKVIDSMHHQRVARPPLQTHVPVDIVTKVPRDEKKGGRRSILAEESQGKRRHVLVYQTCWASATLTRASRARVALS